MSMFSLAMAVALLSIAAGLPLEFYEHRTQLTSPAGPSADIGWTIDGTGLAIRLEASQISLWTGVGLFQGEVFAGVPHGLGYHRFFIGSSSATGRPTPIGFYNDDENDGRNGEQGITFTARSGLYEEVEGKAILEFSIPLSGPPESLSPVTGTSDVQIVFAFSAAASGSITTTHTASQAAMSATLQLSTSFPQAPPATPAPTPSPTPTPTPPPTPAPTPSPTPVPTSPPTSPPTSAPTTTETPTTAAATTAAATTAAATTAAATTAAATTAAATTAAASTAAASTVAPSATAASTASASSVAPSATAASTAAASTAAASTAAASTTAAATAGASTAAASTTGASTAPPSVAPTTAAPTSAAATSAPATTAPATTAPATTAPATTAPATTAPATTAAATTAAPTSAAPTSTAPTSAAATSPAASTTVAPPATTVDRQLLLLSKVGEHCRGKIPRCVSRDYACARGLASLANNFTRPDQSTCDPTKTHEHPASCYGASRPGAPEDDGYMFDQFLTCSTCVYGKIFVEGATDYVVCEPSQKPWADFPASRNAYQRFSKTAPTAKLIQWSLTDSTFAADVQLNNLETSGYYAVGLTNVGTKAGGIAFAAVPDGNGGHTLKQFNMFAADDADAATKTAASKHIRTAAFWSVEVVNGNFRIRFERNLASNPGPIPTEYNISPTTSRMVYAFGPVDGNNNPMAHTQRGVLVAAPLNAAGTGYTSPPTSSVAVAPTNSSTAGAGSTAAPVDGAASPLALGLAVIASAVAATFL